MPKRGDTDKETWIKGYENIYSVDKEGNIFSYKYSRRKLSPQKDTKGYLQVRLYDHNKKGLTLKVHNIMALTFISETKNGLTVDHIDGDKLNNRIDNLRLVTNQVNCEKAISKTYWLLHKDGSKQIIYNLNKWCRENGKLAPSLFRMFSGNRKSAYGFIDGGLYAA